MVPQWTVSLQILGSCVIFKVILSGKYHKDFKLTHFMREGKNHESIPDIFKSGNVVKTIIDLLMFCFVTQ